MALKGDYQIVQSDISFFMNETATRGGVVSVSTVASGAGLDNSTALGSYVATGSGAKPLGILLCDMVDYDLTKQHLNYHKNEVQKGSKVEILRKGWVVTNSLTGGITITGGEDAYVGNNGLITNVYLGGSHVKIGQFLSKKDEDGYAKVEVSLP